MSLNAAIIELFTRELGASMSIASISSDDWLYRLSASLKLPIPASNSAFRAM
jgi:hypothetical protein